MSGLIIKLQSPVDSHESREDIKINKMLSSISPIDFIHLLRKADNKVNPRSATRNPITKSIHETLEMSPGLFWYKTKGLLLATKSCELLDRNRVRISLDDVEYEGIMDGGHNAFAIATFVIEKLFDKKLSDWKSCKDFWDANYDDIVKKFNEHSAELPRFSIPVEVIYPKDEDGGVDEYYDHIAEICAARNNNVQLKEGPKANQRGFYDYLKETLDPKFEVIWKPGDAGIIKSEDVVSMAALPLMFLQEQGLLPEDIGTLNPVTVYSQKSKCVNFFNAVLGHDQISLTDKGKVVLVNDLVKSALDLTSEIMWFFDKLFIEFPNLYNRVSPRFRGIKAVDEDKPRVALFRTGTCADTYPPGFMYPLITGVTELFEVDSTKTRLKWKRAPLTINLTELELDQYVEAIKIVNYDPQNVGKQPLFYAQAKSIFQNYLLRM